MQSINTDTDGITIRKDKNENSLYIIDGDEITLIRDQWGGNPGLDYDSFWEFGINKREAWAITEKEDGGYLLATKFTDEYYDFDHRWIYDDSDDSIFNRDPNYDTTLELISTNRLLSENDLPREGDTVKVKRAGDVIPQIISVDISKRKKLSSKISPPKKCPSCKTQLSKPEGDAILRCNAGQACPAQKSESLIHFVSRNAFNIDGLGERIIELLVEKKLVLNFGDLFKLKVEDVIDLDGFAEKSANNLIDSIQAGKVVPLSRFIYALGIREVGEATAMNLALNFRNIKRFLDANEDDLLEINDIGPIASGYILEFLEDKKNVSMVQELLALGVDPKEVEITNNNPFSSKSIVITGSFNSIARSQLKEELIRVGARVSSSVSSKTDFLIVGDKPGSKLKKASDLGIKILEEDEAIRILNS